MREHLAALCLGFFVDLLLGGFQGKHDPAWAVETAAAGLKKRLYLFFSKHKGQEKVADAVWTMLTVLLTLGAAGIILWLCDRLHPTFGFAVRTVFCAQLLHIRPVRDQSMRACRALERGNLPAAQRAISALTAQDAGQMDAAAVIRTGVETAAENFCTGVLAPVLYMALGGPVLGMAYQTVRSMCVQTQAEKQDEPGFGHCASGLERIMTFIPARLGGFLICAAAPATGQDAGSAFRIFMRDRRSGPSLNTAHTVAAAAGALHVRLGGKQTALGAYVGNDDRPVEPRDILRVNRMNFAASMLAFILLACLLLVFR